MLIDLAIRQTRSQQAMPFVIVEAVMHASHGAQAASGVIEEVGGALQRERKWTAVSPRFPESSQAGGQATSQALSQVEVLVLGITEEAVIAAIPRQQHCRRRTDGARNADHSQR